MSDVIDTFTHFTPTSHDDVPQWINDYFHRVEEMLERLEKPIVEPLHNEPFRKFDGMLVFADGTDWNPGLGRGLYYWDSNEGASGEWVYPIPTSDAFNLFVLIGYGGVFLGTPTAMADLGAGWQTVPADTAIITTPVLVTQDPANDGIVINAGGVWSISVYLAVSHNELNASRNLQLRFWNVTDATQVGSAITIFSGRNIQGFNFSVTALVDILPTGVGDLLVVQIGNGSTFSTVTAESYTLSVNHVSEATTLA